jgi:long-subunit fatty acid transport protein
VIHDALTDERWDIELDAEYQFTSMVESLEIAFAQDRYSKFEIEKNWKDQLSIRLGGTYNVLRGGLGVSAGVHYESRGVDPKYMSVDLWPVERFGLHLGLTVRIDRNTDISFSYAHIFQETIVVVPPEPGGDEDGSFNRRIVTQSDSGSEGESIVLEEDPVTDSDSTASLSQIVVTPERNDAPWIVNSGFYRSNYDIVAAAINFHF